MEILDKSDSEIKEIAEAIWIDLKQGANERDWGHCCPTYASFPLTAGRNKFADPPECSLERHPGMFLAGSQ